MEKVREIFDYLQDPLLVARFQHFCGVRGILTAGSWTTPEPSQAHQNGACLRHGFRGARSENAGEEKPVVGAQMTDTEPKRVARNGAPVPVSAALGEPTVTGTSRRVPDPSGRTVKPLRRNSLTGDVGQEFVIENRFLFFLFTFGTELGNELFYIIFFPFIMWNIDVLVGRRLVMVWVWVMYLGQCTKDLLRWSRPASPPVVKVEMFYNSEYSMPSTHAMSGTAIPFSLFFMTDGRWEYPSSLGFILALCWCLLVCSSRIYMGMHSVLSTGGHQQKLECLSRLAEKAYTTAFGALKFHNLAQIPAVSHVTLERRSAATERFREMRLFRLKNSSVKANNHQYVLYFPDPPSLFLFSLFTLLSCRFTIRKKAKCCISVGL